MSRNLSPGPSQNNFGPQLGPKSKNYSMGIEDAKYHTKYKELKQSVKEIEAENERIHLKVLQAKRNIQRMKLERAILYERLSAIPPSPDVHDRLPAQQQGHSVPDMPLVPPDIPSTSHHRESRNHAGTNDSSFVNYGPPRKEARSLLETPITPLGLGPPTNNSNSGSYSSRRSGNGSQPLPPLNSHTMPPLPPLETSRGHHSPSLHNSHTNSPREHRRSHSGSRHPAPPLPYHPSSRYSSDTLPPVHNYHHSPTSEEPEMIPGAGRRMDFGDLIDRQRGPLSPRPRSSESRSTIHNHQRVGPGSYINQDPRDVDLDRRAEHERQKYREHFREREAYEEMVARERHPHRSVSNSRRRDSSEPPPPQHSPPLHHRYRPEYSESQRQSSRVRDDPAYYHDILPTGSGGGAATTSYARLSRSGTPGSGSPASGSGMVGAEPMSRPDSRDAPFSYRDREDHERRFRLRPVGGPGDDVDFEDGRSQVRDRGGGGSSVFTSHPLESSTSRKRHRGEMDMDVDSNDIGGDGPGGGVMYPPPLPDDRGSKRHHRGHSRRGSDVQDDR